MRGFEYYTPTRVIFGKDTHMKAGELLKEYGCKKGSDPLRQRKRCFFRTSGSDQIQPCRSRGGFCHAGRRCVQSQTQQGLRRN